LELELLDYLLLSASLPPETDAENPPILPSIEDSKELVLADSLTSEMSVVEAN